MPRGESNVAKYKDMSCVLQNLMYEKMDYRIFVLVTLFRPLGTPLFFCPTNLDGGKDHVLAHAEVLLLPEGDEPVVVALELLGAVDGLRVGRAEDEDGAGHLALLPAAVAHLPPLHVRVVPHRADLVLEGCGVFILKSK